MNSNANALTFQTHTLNVVQRNGQVWLRATEIAEALGYSRADKVTQLFDRNRDEFSPAMTQTLKTRVSGLQREIRLFSLRGAHLIAMFARTSVAKQFRAWVLDILDREVDVLRADAAKGARLDDETLHDIESLCTQAELLRSWWGVVAPGIRALNRTLAGNVHDNFINSTLNSRSIVRTLGLMSNREYAADYPWGAGYTERVEYVQQNRRIK